MKTIRVWPFVVLLLLAVSALYGQFLWNPIVFDDLPFFMLDVRGNLPVSGFQFSPFELRSLPYASLAWGAGIFGLNMLHFRVENLLLHVAVAGTMFFFMERLFSAIYGERGTSHLSARGMAFAASLLFALHPVAVYAVGYLVQRTIVMATLFGLLAMLAYLHGSLRNQSRWLWVSVPMYCLAVLSKEHIVMLPAVLIALTVLLHDDWRAQLQQRWGLFVALGAIALFVVAAKRGLLGSVYEIDAPDMLVADSQLSYPLSVLTQSWLFFKYVGLWLFPNPEWMSVDMREPFAPSLWSTYLLAFVAFSAWGLGAIWLLLKRGRLGLLGFAMLFPWLLFMTELSAVRIQESFVLYRSYLWAAGACCLLPLLLDRLDKRVAAGIIAAVMLAMVSIAMDRLASFSHPLLLWDDAEKLVRDKLELPGAYRIYYNRGTELVKADFNVRGIQDLKLAIRLNPDSPFAHNNLGAAYSKNQEWRAAADEFTQAIEIAKRKKMGLNPKPFYGRAMAYEAMGQMELARVDYRLTCGAVKMGCDKL